MQVVARNRAVCLLPVKPAKPHGHAQDAADLVIDRCNRDVAFLDCRQKVGAVQELAGWHLHIEAAIGRGNRVVRGSPIRHDDPIETPLLLRHFAVQIAILGHVQAVGQVVGIHDGPDMRFFDRRFKDRQVDLAHCAFIDDRVCIVAVELRIVSHEMLDSGAHALTLHSLDVGHGNA